MILRCSVSQVQAVMYLLLGYATNLFNPEAEVLIEEALKCWGVALAVEPAASISLHFFWGGGSAILLCLLLLCCRCKQ
jgi:hypothetical protein